MFVVFFYITGRINILKNFCVWNEFKTSGIQIHEYYNLRYFQVIDQNIGQYAPKTYFIFMPPLANSTFFFLIAII